MSGRAEMWELSACGAAVGGTAIWALAASARVGWLRAMLEIFPRSSWDAVTWVLIPVLLILPLVVQGIAVASLASPRPAPPAPAVAGGVAGSLLVLLVTAAAILGGVRHLTAPLSAIIVQILPGTLILGFGVLLATGWLVSAGRWLRILWLRRAALPIAALGGAAAWLLARGSVLAATYVLDRAEVVAFFASVVVGGSVGSAWTACRTARATGQGLTGPKVGRYNVRNVPGQRERGEADEEPFPSPMRK